MVLDDRRNFASGMGIASTAFPAATQAAVETLRAGGNAIDAAVAAAWALAVCEPSGSGLGGKTVLLIRLASGQLRVIDGRSQAPAAASMQRIQRLQQKKGFLACTIPTTPAALGYAHRHYGHLPWPELLEPAIRLAENGFPVSPLYRRQLKLCQHALETSPASRKFFRKDGTVFEIGEIFRQPVLACTLRRLAEAGADDFYSGELAGAIVNDMAKNGGLITLQDLAACRRPVECDPLAIAYRGYQVVSVPPPAGGLQLLVALKILERISPAQLLQERDYRYEVVAQIIHAVFRQRESWSLAPDATGASFYKWILSEERADELWKWIHSQHRFTETGKDDEEEPGETTHLCTADSQGNIVSLTQSLQSLFGAKVANAELGFLYNNCLCTCPRYPHPYQLAGGCLPRSNMAPTLVIAPEAVGVTEPHGPCLALGSAGSRRIISSLLQVISGVLDGALPLAQAVDSPRVHATLTGKAHLEKPAATPALRERLGRHFSEVRLRGKHSYYMGAVQAIQFGADGCWAGVADPRREGQAATTQPDALSATEGPNPRQL